MLQVAATGHRKLCLGQGKELEWVQSPGPLSVDEVIDIFQKKTAPAFEVALKLGVLSVKKDATLNNLLEEYSKALGIAYQIRDDINDFDSGTEASDSVQSRPSLLLAIAWEQAKQKDREVLRSLWDTSTNSKDSEQLVAEMMARLRVKKIAMDLMESYKRRAVSSLGALDNVAFKGLLRRIISKIFNEIDIMSCCNDYKTGNA